MKKLAVVALLFLLGASVMGLAADLEPHSSIYIAGNDGFTKENGIVRGTGKADDPYVLEKWVIIKSPGHGITIVNTDAYCTIRECEVHSSRYSGIVIDHSSNVTNELPRRKRTGYQEAL